VFLAVKGTINAMSPKAEPFNHVGWRTSLMIEWGAGCHSYRGLGIRTGCVVEHCWHFCWYEYYGFFIKPLKNNGLYFDVNATFPPDT